jgi:hypothetical protein
VSGDILVVYFLHHFAVRVDCALLDNSIDRVVIHFGPSAAAGVFYNAVLPEPRGGAARQKHEKHERPPDARK